MKVSCYPQAMISVFILLFAVNLWAKDDIQIKGSDLTEKSTAGQAFTQPAPKEPTAAGPETTDALPKKKQADDSALIDQTAYKNEKVPQTEQKASVVPPQEAKTAEIPSEGEYWTKKVDHFTDVLVQPEQADINALYSKLTAAFDLSSAKLKKRFREKQREADTHKDTPVTGKSVPYLIPVSQDELYHTVHTLYYQRHRLFEHLSAEIHNEHTGTGVEGMKELKRELAFLRQTISYRVEALPQVIKKLLNDLSIAPLPTIGYLLQFVIALMVFRYWRRWAPDGLYKMRDRLMNVRPQTKSNLRLAGLIRYFDQARSPIEWFVLLSLIFSFIEEPGLTFFIEIARITVNWVLLSWMGILFINALIARSARSLNKQTADLTLRSLKYAGTWLIFSGLNIGLITRYAGQGTLYAWAFSTNEVLLLFLLVVLLAIWRPSIFRSLENDPQQNFITEAALKHPKGLTSYLYIILGAGYLLRVYITKRFISLISDPNTGQQVLDSLMDMEFTKAYENQKDDPDAKPIPPDLEEKLMSYSDTIIKQAGDAVLKKILNRAEKGPGGVIVVVGDIGGGKTVLLQRVARESDKQSVLVSCPKEGLDALIKELARKLHIDSKEPKRRVVFEELKRKNIDVLLIDNIHRLIRPYVGGQNQLNKLGELFVHVPDILCVISCNFVSWQYIVRARAKHMIEKNTLTLQSWTTDQIATLVRNSWETLNIDPDFSKVVIPRQFDFSNDKDPNAKTFSGFIRMLHVAAMGNPKVALALWAKSLYINKYGKVAVHLPRLPSSDELNNANLTMLLVLRVIYQSEIITREDVVKSLQISDAEVNAALRTSIFNQWVEVIDEEYYRINWYWRKVITRVLTRQNLMPRNY